MSYDTTDGYRYYEVTDRTTSKALGGLQLPIPEGISCRLNLAGGTDGLRFEGMTSSRGGATGDASAGAQHGIYTAGISGCQAIGIFTYEGGRWTRYFFHHCLAGYYNLAMAARHIINPPGSFAFVAQAGTTGLESAVDAIVQWVRVPKLNIIGYNAGSSAGIFGFGVRLTGRPFGGHFGEA